MGFHEVQFPPDLSYGTSGGPGYSTAIIELDSGKEERIPHWNQARRRYNAAYSIRKFEDLKKLIDFYIGRLGPAYGFRFKDWLDFTTGADHRSAYSSSDYLIGTGDNSTTNFQLIKQYTSGPVTRTRTLTKPITGKVAVEVNGVPKTEGVDFTVDYTTGIVTFFTPPPLDWPVRAGCEFDVPVRFGIELDLSIPLSIDNFSTGGIDDIPIVEIVPDIMEDEFYYGGSLYVTDDGESPIPVTLSPTQARVILFKMFTAPYTLLLPDPSLGWVGGGPYWYLQNHTLSLQNVIIKDYLGTTTVATLTPGDGVIVVFESNTASWWLL